MCPYEFERSVSLLDSLLDSETSSEEEHREGEAEDLNGQVRREVLAYFGGGPLPKKKTHYMGGMLTRIDPTMARLAKSYLCIPGTSTPSEPTSR